MRKSEIRLLIRELREEILSYHQAPFRMGDMINLLEDVGGEKIYGLLDRLGIAESQLYDFARVARTFPPDDRPFKLPWTYYRDAGSDREIADPLLAAVVKNDWSRSMMRKAKGILDSRSRWLSSQYNENQS